MVLDFPYITTLPLELLVEITNALEIAAEEGRQVGSSSLGLHPAAALNSVSPLQPTLAHLSGTAAVKIYTKRVDAVVRRLRTTFIRPQSTDKWQEEYLKPLKGGTEQVGRRQEWLPSGRNCSGWRMTLLSKFPSPSKNWYARTPSSH